MFTKRETEFMDWLDAVVDAELDLETTIQTNKKAPIKDYLITRRIHEDFLQARKLRKQFFDWFKKNSS